MLDHGGKLTPGAVAQVVASNNRDPEGKAAKTLYRNLLEIVCLCPAQKALSVPAVVIELARKPLSVHEQPTNVVGEAPPKVSPIVLVRRIRRKHRAAFHLSEEIGAPMIKRQPRDDRLGFRCFENVF